MLICWCRRQERTATTTAGMSCRLSEVTPVSSKPRPEFTDFDVGNVYEARHDGERVVIISVHSCYVWHVPRDVFDDEQLQQVSSMRANDQRMQLVADALPEDEDATRDMPREFKTAYRRVEA